MHNNFRKKHAQKNTDICYVKYYMPLLTDISSCVIAVLKLSSDIIVLKDSGNSSSGAAYWNVHGLYDFSFTEEFETNMSIVQQD